MTIHYEVSGKGYPVVFLHGYGETHKIWNHYRERLSKKYKVITPDLPGFGKSDSLPYEHSLDMVANSIYDCLKRLNVSECIIMGHSLGGYVTLEIAKRFPNIVSHIGLIHSSALSDTEEKRKDGKNLLNSFKSTVSVNSLKVLFPCCFTRITVLNYKTQFNQ